MHPILLFCLLLWPTLTTAEPAPRVLTSIGPLQLIAQEVMGERGEVDVLMPGDASPHHFQLKPSQLRLAQQADLLIWVSSGFETGLGRLAAGLAPDIERLELLPRLPAGQLIGDDHQIDGHLWLSPRLAAAMAHLIARQLARLDAAHAQGYLANAESLQANLDAWLDRTRQHYAATKPLYLVDHDFLAYLQRDLDILAGGTLRDSHDHGGSVRRLHHLQQQLRDNPANCLLVDRLPASRQAQQVAREHLLEIRQVSILDGASQANSILDMYRRIGDSLDLCTVSQ